MRMSPTAIGQLVFEPSAWSDPIHVPKVGAKYPRPTPIPIAIKIQSVRNRSRKPRRFGVGQLIEVRSLLDEIR